MSEHLDTLDRPLREPHQRPVKRPGVEISSSAACFCEGFESREPAAGRAGHGPWSESRQSICTEGAPFGVSAENCPRDLPPKPSVAKSHGGALTNTPACAVRAGEREVAEVEEAEEVQKRKGYCNPNIHANSKL